MASEYRRLLDPLTLGADQKQSQDEVFDAGAYNVLQVHCRILKSGSAGNLKLTHAAINEPDAYIDIVGASWAVAGGGTFVSVSNFLRYVRWMTDSSVAGGPVALIDVIAKE